MASARAPGWVDLLSSGVMLCFKADTPEEFVAAMQVVKGLPLDALPDGTELKDTIFNNIRFLCRAILRPCLEHRLLETAASPDDGQIPLLAFNTPLAVCRVIKHIATHERFPTEDELHDYDATFAVTNDASIIADVQEGARRRGVPESDCLGALVYLSRPGGGFSSDIAWPLESWRVMIPRA